MKEVNAIGLSCPQPVIMAAKAISEGEFPFTLIVDSAASCENVTRIAEKKGCGVSTAESSGSFLMVIDKK
ncbi:MAG: sulfurtransferase TusA family protein [Spirochaetia bacterium]|jgi:TusA-related sulfurtransferase|nr:sulfurtransferase TusA family protein [Spirochaetia bacterium]